MEINKTKFTENDIKFMARDLRSMYPQGIDERGPYNEVVRQTQRSLVYGIDNRGFQYKNFMYIPCADFNYLVMGDPEIRMQHMFESSGERPGGCLRGARNNRHRIAHSLLVPEDLFTVEENSMIDEAKERGLYPQPNDHNGKFSRFVGLDLYKKNLWVSGIGVGQPHATIRAADVDEIRDMFYDSRRSYREVETTADLHYGKMQKLIEEMQPE